MAQETIGVGFIGCGTVGVGVARLLAECADLYAQRLGKPLALRRVLVRDAKKAREGVPAGVVTGDANAFFETADMPIVVEVAGGLGEVAGHFGRALELKKHVVTANKSLLAQRGPELFALARRNGVCIAFEASCGGGVPIINAVQFGLSANRIAAVYGILNGTSNFILTAMTRHGRSYADALREAQANGFAEADPTLDVSGRDAAQKLAVLASLAFGVQANDGQVVCRGIDSLDLTDIRFGAELGYDIKLLAIGERAGVDGRGKAEKVSLRTEPCFIHADQPLAQVHGSFNALSVFGHAVGHTMYYGRGAGALPTASAVVADVLNVASGWYPAAFMKLNLWPDRYPPVPLADPDDLESRYYLRINALDVPGVMARVSAVLGEAGIGLSAVLQHEPVAGRFVPVVITTHRAREGDLRGALAGIEKLNVIEGRPVCIRIVDLPKG